MNPQYIPWDHAADEGAPGASGTSEQGRGKGAVLLIVAGWITVAAAVVASFVLTGVETPAMLAIVAAGALGIAGVCAGCALVLRSLTSNWAGAVVLGLVMAGWTAMGLLLGMEEGHRETERCRVVTVSKLSTGEFSKVSYRYEVACPSGARQIVDRPSSKQNAPSTVYAPGGSVDVSYDPTGRNEPYIGGNSGPPVQIMAIFGSIGAAILTAVTLVLVRRRTRPEPVPWSNAAVPGSASDGSKPRLPVTRWGWALIGAGWLVMPAGVAVGGLLSASRVLTFAVLLLGHLCLIGGCLLAGIKDRSKLPGYLVTGLMAALVITFPAVNAVEKLRLAVHGREYICEIALARTVPGSQPPISIRGSFVLCPNNSYARMKTSFGLSDVGDRARVTWDPERRQRATLSRDLEAGDLAKALLRVPLVMVAAPGLALFLPWLLDPTGATRRRRPEPTTP